MIIRDDENFCGKTKSGEKCVDEISELLVSTDSDLQSRECFFERVVLKSSRSSLNDEVNLSAEISHADPFDLFTNHLNNSSKNSNTEKSNISSRDDYADMMNNGNVRSSNYIFRLERNVSNNKHNCDYTDLSGWLNDDHRRNLFEEDIMPNDIGYSSEYLNGFYHQRAFCSGLSSNRERKFDEKTITIPEIHEVHLSESGSSEVLPKQQNENYIDQFGYNEIKIVNYQLGRLKKQNKTKKEEGSQPKKQEKVKNKLKEEQIHSKNQESTKPKDDKNTSKTSLMKTHPGSKISIKLEVTNAARKKENDALGTETDKTGDDKKMRENHRVSIQGSRSIRHVPTCDVYASSKCHLQGSTARKGLAKTGSANAFPHHLIVDNDSNFSLVSTSLYIDPPYFGCNEDCIGTKTGGNIVNRPGNATDSSLSMPEVPMENSSTIPLLSKCGIMPDLSLIENKPVEANPKVPQKTAAQNEWHPQLNFVTVQPNYLHRPHRNQHQGIPHRSHERHCCRQVPEANLYPKEEFIFGDCRCNHFETLNDSRYTCYSPPIEGYQLYTRKPLEESNYYSKFAEENRYYKKPAAEPLGKTTKNNVSNERTADHIVVQPTEKKKRQWYLCKSGKAKKEKPVAKKKKYSLCGFGKVDKGELSGKENKEGLPVKEDKGLFLKVNPEETFDKSEYINTERHQGIYSRAPTMPIPCKCQHSPNFDDNRRLYGIDNNFGLQRKTINVDVECPFRTAPLSKVTKSVKCGTEPSVNTHRQNIIDSGRNITIQIIPNCNYSSTQRQFASEGYQPKPMENIVYSQRTCCDDNQKSAGNVQSVPDTCAMNNEMPASCYRREQYRQYDLKDRQFNRWWSCNWLRKKQEYPYHRSQNFKVPQDCCVSAVQNPSGSVACQRVLSVSDNTPMIAYQDCQRVLPIQNIYGNKDEHLLKSLHRLNKGLIRDLFATPCPSSAACPPNTSVQRAPVCYPLKPATVNQCSQCEPNINSVQMGREKSCHSLTENKVLCECLKILNKKIAHVEDRYEFEDEVEECGWCCQSYNNCCCCCCHYQPKCCCCCPRPKDVQHKEVQQKVATPCCTRCRSIQTKPSLKHCGTAVSNQCFTKETVCTNTEPVPKTPKIEPRKKRVRCCRPRCCNCCRHPTCCQHEPNMQCCHSGPQTCCQCEHMTFCCQCEHKIPFYGSVVKTPLINTKETILERCIEVLKSNMNSDVTKETKQIGTAEYQSVKSCQYTEAKSEVKSTNTRAIDKDAQERRHELIKSVTLDLCNLEEKTFSKFGAPSRYYPWTSRTYLSSMPNEVYRFIGAETNQTLVRNIHDPTPCLQPEVLTINYPQVITQPNEFSSEPNMLDAAGDIKDGGMDKKRYLSAICKEMFVSEKGAEHNFQNITDLNWIPNKKSNFLSDTSFAQCNKPGILMETSGCSKSDTNPASQREKPTLGVTRIELNSNTNTKTDGAEANTKPIRKNPTKQKRSVIKPVKKFSGKSETNKDQTKPINTDISYTSKPFTTRTGLMSFTPSFRDSFRSCTQVSKTKLKPTSSNVRKVNKKNIKSTMKNDEHESKPVDLNKPNELEGGNVKTKNINANLKTTNNETEQVSRYSSINEESEEKESVTSIKEETLEDAREQIKLNIQDSTTRNELEKKESVTNLKKVSDLQNKEDTFSKTTVVKEAGDENHLKTGGSSTSHSVPKEDNTFNFTKFDDEIYTFCNKCMTTCNETKTDIPVPYFKTSVSDIVKSLESRSSYMNSPKSRPFLSSLLGTSTNSIESNNEVELKECLYDNDCLNESSFHFSNTCSDYDSLYGRAFQRSFEHNGIEIPNKIMSKTDLMSLN